jgi:hypothetical protein
MRRFLFLFPLAAVCAAFAADAQFNGRWDLKVINESRRRAWWLEVSGAGTAGLKGRFVGFPGGDMNDIEQMAIKDGVLRFTFDRPARGENRAIHQEYTARLAGGKLEGTMKAGRQELKWVGERAPEIADKDDGSWKPGKPVALFNGKDLSGWHGIVAGQDLGWTVENGMLKSTGHANNLETDAKFWNYTLHIEYRVGPKSNSGVGLRGRYEVQILEDYGRPLDRHSNGALYSRIIPAVAASKPAGEWQTYDIRLVGRNVKVVLNDKKVVEGVIEGLTAIATDCEEGKPGPLTLQGDHGPVEFRSVVLTPLEKK